MGILTLEKIVKDIHDIPPLPQVALRVLRLLDDVNTNISEVERVIATDQALAAKILKIVNSAYYGFSRKISLIKEAIAILGYNAIRSLVLTVSVYGTLNRKIDGYSLEKGELWRHSLGCAICSKIIAKKVRFRAADDAYTVGLLHDIGKIVLDAYVLNQFGKLTEMVSFEDLPFMDAEEALFGFNHAQVGGVLVEKWNLPKLIVDVVSFHHKPEEAKEFPQLTAIVHVADAICLMLGIGIGGDGLCYPISPASLELLRLSEEDVQEIMSEFLDTIGSPDNLLDL